MLILLALAIGTVNAVDMPVRQAFSVEMVGREDIGNAVALNSAMFNGARVIGPAVAGITIGLVGVPWAFTVDALSFLAVIVALALMRDAELMSPARIARPESVSDVMAQLREGLSYVRRTPIVLMSLARDRPGVDLRHELQRRDPAARRGRAAQRRHRVRLPHGGVRPRLAAGGPVARLPRRGRARPSSASAR